MTSLLIALILLGQAEAGVGVAQFGEIVNICYGPPPSCAPPVFQRAITVKTIVDVPACPPRSTMPDEKSIFPEIIFLQAHRAAFKDGALPHVLDLRALAVFQRRLGERGGFVSGVLYTYAVTSVITGHWPSAMHRANSGKVARRWAQTLIYPPASPATWCDFDRDGDVDREDWLAFFKRSVWNEE